MFNPKQFVVAKRQRWNELNDEQKAAVKKSAKTLAAGGIIIVGVYAVSKAIERKLEENSDDEDVVEVNEEQEEV